MAGHRKNQIDTNDGPGVMMNVFDHVGLMGRKMHIWKRHQFPDVEAFHDFSYNAWDSFKNYLETTFEIDKSASLRWLLNEKEVGDRLRECLHLKQGYTVFFTDYDKKVELIYDSESTQKNRKKLVEKLNELKEPRGKDEIGLLTRMHGLLDVKFFKFRQYEHDLIPYLGDEIKATYQDMVQQIQAKYTSGLYLLYGKPGTGKTSFIKRVISEVDKEAIFVTPSMAEYLASPELIELLSDHSDSVLVIEDAEKILMKREGDNSNAVSTILNLSDGFTADFLNLNIICTFNTEISEIDPALLRKGRLKGMQEFKKLNEKTIYSLIDKFDLKLKNIQPMTLAELWNNGGPVKKPLKKRVGF